MTRKHALLGLALLVGACASGPQVTTIQPLAETADAPYDNVLVVSLFESFDLRRYMEEAIVKDLLARGINASASTSMMNTRTPVTRQTFVSMVQQIGADAVLVTQPVSLETSSKMRDMNPQKTVNVRPTYWYNVFTVEVTEYTEPQGLELTSSVVLGVQMYSVKTREPVWAIETTSKVVQSFQQSDGARAIEDEGKAIVSHLARDGLISR